MSVVYEDDYVTIKVNEVGGYVEHEWKKFCPMEPFKAALNKTHQLMIDNNKKKLVIGMEKLGAYNQESTSWVQSDWFPKMMRQGVKNYAIAMGSSALGKMSINRTKDSVQSQVDSHGVKTEYFGTLVEARAYMTSV